MSENTTNDSSLRNLGRIGARGMVVHSGRAAEGRYGYYPDNEEETWHSKAVDLETYAEKHKLDPTVVKTLVSYGVPVTVVPGKSRRAEKHTILVNLDAFRGLKADRKGARRADESPMGEMPEQFDGLLIQEDEKYYALAPTDFHPLEPEDAGEAQVLVRRGALAAAIPNNDLPIGTNCVLVNLTQLLPQ